jgi:shikimate dehydrogenase
MKKLGLIGFPLKNSFSKNYFTQKFVALGLVDFSYENFPIANISSFPDLMLQYSDWVGLNVTIPYKQSVIAYMDELDETASAVGAVNCIRLQQKNLSSMPHLIGYNTDVYGFEQSLFPLLVGKKIEHALLLGSGGASKAVAYVLQQLQIPFRVVSRNPQTNQIGYEDLSEEIMEMSHLIVNCTPLGMFPQTESFPEIPYQYLSQNHIAYDLIYLPEETAFLKRCKQQGAITQNGMKMLHLQAEKAWEIWNRP